MSSTGDLPTWAGPGAPTTGGSGGESSPPPPDSERPAEPPRGPATQPRSLPIPSNFWCTKHSECVRPAGHSGRCALKFDSEETRTQKLLSNFAKWQVQQAEADNTSDEEADDAGEGEAALAAPPGGGRGSGGAPALTALPPETSTFAQRLAALEALVRGGSGPNRLGAAGGAAAVAAPAGLPPTVVAAAAAGAPASDPNLRLLDSLLMGGAPQLGSALPSGGGPAQQGPGGGGFPFIPDPAPVTNATAASIPGLDAAATQLTAAHSYLSVPSAVPIPIAGFGTTASGAGPRAGGQGGLSWDWDLGVARGSEAVPPQPVLLEHVAGTPAYGLPTQETTLHLSLGLNNETVFKPAGLPASKRSLTGAQLAQAIPNYAEYLQDSLKVCRVLSMHNYSLAGMPQFQGAMLQLGQRVNHSDTQEWGMFLELDRTLRSIQHAFRLRWDHEGGYISYPECQQFLALIAGRHAALAVRGPRPTKQPQPAPDPRSFRPHAGGEQKGVGPAPTDADCKQWWRAGRCSFGARCKFEHVCRLCLSKEHGTGQCPAR